jgi:hypothetical protein
MNEAAFAAESLRDDHDARTRRLIETAMVVSYIRPFTTSSLGTLTEYVPAEPPESDLHEYLNRLETTAKLSSPLDSWSPAAPDAGSGECVHFPTLWSDRSEPEGSIKGSRHRTLEIVQARGKQKAPICGAFAEPSDGLEPSTPSLP